MHTARPSPSQTHDPREPQHYCTHSTVGVDLGALHGNGDAIEEDDYENHMVKHLVGDDPVTQETEPAQGYPVLSKSFQIFPSTYQIPSEPSDK